MLLGPVAGGILISVVSAPWALVVDACTYLVSAGLILALVPRPAPLPRTDEDVGARRGIRFLAREPLLRLWTPLFLLGDTAWTAFFVSVPVLVVTRFDADPRIAGWLLAAFGVGAVVGNAVAYRVLLNRVGGLTLVGTCIIGQALPLWILTFYPEPWLAATALGLSGVANGLVNPSIHSLMTLRVPAALRPSVMTVNVMLFGLVQPLGVFGAGPVLDAFGAQPVLVAFAAVQTVAMSLVAVVCFAIRRREKTVVQATRVAA
jgi:predicted MFS family arabinose efflux permease